MPAIESTPVIELRGLKKRFGIGDAELYALDGVDLVIEKGEFITVMGPSGCGKTTLLNIIGLLDRATDGDYTLEDRLVSSMSSRRKARIRSRKIGFVFQSFNLISRLTVIENVALPLTYKGVRRVARLEMASKMLRNFHLGEREYYMPYQLSGGQTQRVAIARALVNEPSIILADEPTGNLDSRSSHVIMEELSDLHKRGNTIIMVTHNPRLTTYASRVITMLDGKIDTDTKIPPPKPPAVAPKRPLGQLRLKAKKVRPARKSKKRTSTKNKKSSKSRKFRKKG
jgi:putative ABC transport system ATP-binding protein